MTKKINDIPDSEPEKSSVTSLLKNSFSIYTPFIIFVFALALYIRAVLPYDATFRGDIIAFAADDAVYHMRLVENLVVNFPHKIWFEPFTHYPYGQNLHFGPLWTYMIATTSLIIGLGSPSIELIRTIGAYFPAVFGALMVFPVYYIGRDVFNKRVGLLAASMIAVMPGQFLNRSMLGFTDHHIGEVLFSTMFIMFFIMAIKSARDKDISFIDVQSKNWNKMKRPVIFSIFAGIAFGLYMLQWSSGVFFGGIVAMVLVLQYIVDHMRGKSIEGLCLISVISFLAAFPLILIVFDPVNGFNAGRYSYLHILITLGSAVFFLGLGIISVKMKKKKMETIYYPISIIAIYAVGIIIAKVSVQGAFSSFQKFFAIFKTHTGGGLTVAEAQPPTPQMLFGYAKYPDNFCNYPGILDFLSSYYIALLGMVVIGALLIFRKWEPERSMLLIWCITIFALTTAQNRWFYYYSVNVAILSAFIGIGILDIAGLKSVLSRFRTEVSGSQSFQEFFKTNLPRHLFLAFVAIVVIMVLLLPNFNIASRSTVGGIAGSDYYQWHESMTWMRYNTPDPGLDFDAIYDRPPAGETFQYPDSAYGVMSWWDYGHVITYFGHRIPNANPFQAGIGGGTNHAPGASTFFTAQSEEAADQVLHNLSVNGKPASKYIVSNAYMAYSITNIMGVWDGHDQNKYTTWAVISGQEQPIYTEFWYTSMEGRLHIFDGDGLQHYRLIHESIANPYTRGGADEQRCKAIYNMAYGGNIPIENTGYVKIFEVVPGAIITGSAPDGMAVTVTNVITTNQNRSFNYVQTTTANNGVWNITVPYSTLGPTPGETNFDTAPTGPYSIIIGNMIRTVDVSENDVLNGGVVT